MKTLTVKDAKYSFGRLIGLVRAEPVTAAKHGRSVAMAVEGAGSPPKEHYWREWYMGE